MRFLHPKQSPTKQKSDGEPSKKRRKVSNVNIKVTNPRKSNKERSHYTSEYIEKFATSIGYTKILVSNVHDTTRQVNAIQFDTTELSKQEQRILDTPKPCAAREQLLIYNQHINDSIHTVFNQKKEYKNTPVSFSLDTSQLKVRQKENVYDTIYNWNIEPNLLTQECKNKGCKYGTFTYKHSIGKFDKINKIGEVYTDYIMNDIKKSGICNVDFLIGDGESALQSSPKHLRKPDKIKFREKYRMPRAVQSIDDALHNIWLSMNTAAKVLFL